MSIRLHHFNVIVGVLIAASFVTSVVAAQTFVGTVIAVKGDVKILHIPLSNDAGPFAKLHNQKYAYHKAKIGDKVNSGEIVLSGTNGVIRIVYPNGDTFLIGHGSSFVLPSVTNKSSTSHNPNSMIKLFYGRFRALVSKTGPRNRLEVVTPDAVAGVRGTDFFVRSNASVGTQLTVLRGDVALRTSTPQSQPQSQTVMVKTGYSATANVETNSQTKAAAPQVTMATRETLVSIRKESAIETDPRALAALPQAEQQNIHQLQKKAFDSVMADVHSHDPSLYQTLKTRAVKNVNQVSNIEIARLWHNAPTAKNQKPTRKELENSGRNVYRHYYHPSTHP